MGKVYPYLHYGVFVRQNGLDLISKCQFSPLQSQTEKLIIIGFLLSKENLKGENYEWQIESVKPIKTYTFFWKSMLRQASILKNG